MKARTTTAAMVLMLLGACTRPDPYQQRLDLLSDALEITLEEPHAHLRFNPAPCQCPAFELEAGGRWLRVAIVETESPAPTLEEFAARCETDLARDAATSYLVTASLDSSVPLFCPNGTPYFRIALHAVENGELPAPDGVEQEE